ncbi:hypothetical protein MVES1_003730 [Malassezia vespertilionis]|uniref:Uncharacterized protein n=1 Tax=Malassezia vespertilionis TaxID=2020962 RepID=A0A2N1J8E1_9BASI|nr:uncharacterized protein MVES1_003730 [Malassezia vespertilionis]PKI82813.1 hypothetical protein MVES_003288 [Malassezia vespertilionis]WFD08358.1 hypothetical protein MVES1_003730 [Malassezia vespertilionis]
MLRGVVKNALRAPMRSLTTSAVRCAETEASKYPKGTIIPGSKVDPQLGSYPDMPEQNLQFRPYFSSWWDKQDRHNFNEPVQEQDDILNMWAPDAYKTPGPYALKCFSIAVATIATFSYFLYHNQAELPALRKTFPRGGLAQELGGEHARARIPSDDAGEDDEELDEE